MITPGIDHIALNVPDLDAQIERLTTAMGLVVEHPAMRLWIDAEKLRAYGLSPLDVRAAVNRENVELPSGRIEGDAVELPVKTCRGSTRRRSSTHSSSSAAATRRAFRRRRLRRARRAERARRAQDGRQADRRACISGRSRAPIRSRSSTSCAAGSRRSSARCPTTSRSRWRTTTRSTCAARCSRSRETIFIAFALVVLVVFAFLREWRTTLIPVIAIPVSIVGAFGDHGGRRVLHQHADAARHRAVDRPRGRRRDRRAREHLREDRGGHARRSTPASRARTRCSRR